MWKGRTMDKEALKQAWLKEEEAACITGWDFSHIRGRYQEEDRLPWDYTATIRQYLDPAMRLMDMDTGGGEFLLSLHHPHHLTAATEGYPPNAALCAQRLTPLGIDFRRADGADPLPFDNESFDIVINRHGDYRPEEVFRVLKNGGYFITQQVGAENDHELVRLLLPKETALPFPKQYLTIAADNLQRAGFLLLHGDESFTPIRFYDVGALVWFARIIEWEFPGFNVEGCLDRLYEAQRILEEKGRIEGLAHRYLAVAKKPELFAIEEVRENKQQYLPLLLLGDEQESMISRYLSKSRLYVLKDGGVKAVCAVTDEGQGVLEIKNIAVVPAAQGKGYGKKMIEWLVRQFRGQYRILQAGTGDSPLTVPFYERCGFHRAHTVPNFFLEHYDHPIVEGGITLKDMVYFQRTLQP